MALPTKLARLLFLLGAVLAGPLFCAHSSEAPVFDPLEQRVPALVLSHESLIDGVAQLSNATGLAFSIEHILRASIKSPQTPEVTFTAEVRDKTLRETLDWLCQLDPRYTWISDSKTINIVPHSKINDPHYMMNKRLRRFKLRRALRADEPAFIALKQLPGRHEQLAFVQVGGNLAYTTPWTEELENISLRELLNLSARRLGPTFGWQLFGSDDFRVVIFHAALSEVKAAKSHSGQHANDALARSARVEPRERVAVRKAFGQLLSGAGVPGGIASVEGCDAEPTQTLEGKESSLKDALDSLVVSYPSYRWEIRDNVVNVLPARGSPALLETEIAFLEIDDQAPPSLLLERVFESPEVRARAQELKLHLGRIQLGIGKIGKPGTHPPKESVATVQKYRSLTVRQALNAIVLLRGKSVWSYHERRCGQQGVFNVAMPVD